MADMLAVKAKIDKDYADAPLISETQSRFFKSIADQREQFLAENFDKIRTHTIVEFRGNWHRESEKLVFSQMVALVSKDDASSPTLHPLFVAGRYPFRVLRYTVVVKGYLGV